MKYANLSRYTDSEFKRLIGVPRKIFDEMVHVLIWSECRKKRLGRPHTLVLEDQLLLTLKYLRSYVTQFELSVDYGLSESNVNRTILKVENALMKSGKFNLPKKQLATEDEASNWVIIDVTETRIERPKKNKKTITVAKKSSIH